MTTKQNIEKALWNACDSFRGKIDSSRYKDYILSMLFVKYLSDVYAHTRQKYVTQYGNDEERTTRAMRRERFGRCCASPLCIRPPRRSSCILSLQ